MVRVCWPGPMVCRSGTALEAGIPKSAFAGLRDSFVFVRLPMNDERPVTRTSRSLRGSFARAGQLVAALC